MESCWFTKALLLSSLTLCMTGVTTGLPPEVFPKDLNGTIAHGELPPRIFPDEKSLPFSQAVLTSTDSNDKGLKKDIDHDDTKSKISKDLDKTAKVASEVPDLLSTDFMNRTVYEDGTETPINNDTETVSGPHVISDSKTHEEDVTKSTVKKKPLENDNKTVETNSADEKKKSAAMVSVENKTIDDHLDDKNELTTSTTIMSPTNETEAEDKQNTSASTTIHNDHTETTSDQTNFTTEESLQSVNETEVPEQKSLDNNTNTSEHSVSTLITSTIKPNLKNDSDINDKEEGDLKNKTVPKDEKDKSSTTTTASAPSKSTTPTKDIEGNNTTVQLPPKVETTTFVNISENIIDHKAEALAASQKHSDHQHASSGKSSPFLQPTESAAILAGVFVGIAFLGYVGLLVWRRILEKRYGNREMLVNEDDFYDTNDLRNFEL